MKLEDFSAQDQSDLLPEPQKGLVYRCLGCQKEHPIDQLLYTCPECGQVLLIENNEFSELKKKSGKRWQRIFDLRKTLNIPALKGIFRFHELVAPVIPADCVIYLGEGSTPMVEASGLLQSQVGARFYYKNDGQNPSASFKDRGMAAAMAYINYLIKYKDAGKILSVCASTGDTSAAAALYASYLSPNVASSVLLPKGKVTPQQLAQPLGSGAQVFEVPGVFDDCMKVVEHLAENFQVALLNSKNPWRILGQESYAFEVAQELDYGLKGSVIVVPIGNAGNISAIMRGFMKMYELEIIDSLPMILGVQSHHADPVFQYYSEPNPDKRKWQPMTVKPSVAQAAMIGNPVSMPRVVELAGRYEKMAGPGSFHVVQVNEQAIMDSMIQANRHGHIACTQGGESLAGLKAALAKGIVGKEHTAVLDATAHHLKFIGFQQMYFEDNFPAEMGVTPVEELRNYPQEAVPSGLERLPAPGNPLDGEDFKAFVRKTAELIAKELGLKVR